MSDGKWVSCSERLPEEDIKVLVFTASDDMEVAYCTDEWGNMVWTTGDFGSGTLDVIAWMPLPEPYTGKSD